MKSEIYTVNNLIYLSQMRVFSNKTEGDGLLSDITGAVINESIDRLPMHLHLLGYHYYQKQDYQKD